VVAPNEESPPGVLIWPSPDHSRITHSRNRTVPRVLFLPRESFSRKRLRHLAQAAERIATGRCKILVL
jgi:hypothetical protein